MEHVDPNTGADSGVDDAAWPVLATASVARGRPPTGNPCADTILVCHDQGAVVHRFCTSDEAARALELAGAGSMFTAQGVGAALVYDISPDLRERVEQAKRRLRADLALREMMDRHDIPHEHALRNKVAALAREWRAA